MISLEVNTCASHACVGMVSKQALSAPDFPQQLAAPRKLYSLTQQALAERIGIHVIQLRRYEAGSSQRTLDVIRRFASALKVSADLLLFGTNGRGPDEDLRSQFKAVSRFDSEEKQVLRNLLEGLILKHEAHRWQTVTNGERK